MLSNAKAKQSNANASVMQGLIAAKVMKAVLHKARFNSLRRLMGKQKKTKKHYSLERC